MLNGITLTGSTTSVGLADVVNATGDVFDLAMTCFDTVLSNPILLFFFASGLIGTGLGIFNMLKNAAKS